MSEKPDDAFARFDQPVTISCYFQCDPTLTISCIYDGIAAGWRTWRPGVLRKWVCPTHQIEAFHEAVAETERELQRRRSQRAEERQP